MCGRYTITTPAKELASYFGLLPPNPGERYKPTEDARPTGDFPIVLEDDPNRLVIGHWGYPILLSGKEKELINIRAESIIEKPFFQRAARDHRCIILADGFYEWKKVKDGKSEKYRFSIERRPMAFAGLFMMKQKTTSKETRPFFSIITTAANKTMAPIHDRMPVILQKGHERDWLSPKMDSKLLIPFAGKLTVKSAR